MASFGVGASKTRYNHITSQNSQKGASQSKGASQACKDYFDSQTSVKLSNVATPTFLYMHEDFSKALNKVAKDQKTDTKTLLNTLTISPNISIDVDSFKVLGNQKVLDTGVGENLGQAPQNTLENLMSNLLDYITPMKEGDIGEARDTLMNSYYDLKDNAEDYIKQQDSSSTTTQESIAKEAELKESVFNMSQFGASLQRTISSVSEESTKTDIESVSTSSESSYEVHEDNILNKEVKTRDIQDLLGRTSASHADNRGAVRKKWTPQKVIHYLLKNNPKWQASTGTGGKKAVESHFDQIKKNLCAAFTNQQNESLQTMLKEIDVVQTNTNKMLINCKGNIDDLPEPNPDDQIQNSALANAKSYLTRASQ
ncbi:MAG: hypothetical protein CMP39_06910 [Rickettsiales bacterium]|nr:hypothetical protein [Rickettsiales bacterium]|tara:strand:- start:325 stop:1431 length:1107 start_codon:yes stop_codon:yes gene_type:complete